MKKILFGFLGFLFVVPVSADFANCQHSPFSGCESQTVFAADLVAASAEAPFEFECVSEEISASIVYGDVSSNGSVGCDNEDNEFIAPDLALCTTHVYNIGDMDNPSNETTRAYMREVIALKTTFMAQQMNKQYEYLESMIRRFKTQLEKAILTTRLQAAGSMDSSTDGGSSSFKSNDRNVFISGVENCNNKLLPADVLTCLNTNLTTISNMSGNGSDVSSDVRKQFTNDFVLLKSTYSDTPCTEVKGVDCSKDSDLKKRVNFQKCMDEARSCIRNKMYNLNLKTQQNSRYPQY